MIHDLAQDLNATLNDTVVGNMMSPLGTRLYFPKGIIAQSGEAKKLGKTANGTIGMGCVNEMPLILPCIQSQLPNLRADEIVAYAPTAGDNELREFWKKKILEKNPDLQNKMFSLPVVVPGLTAGIAYLCDLFLPENETLIATNPSWDNYTLIVTARNNANLVQFPMFDNHRFNIAGFKSVIDKEAETGKIRLLLNFPHNPSGYSPTTDEIKEICAVLRAAAEKGTHIMVWCDDAYFGLNYEKNIERQSIFAFLADIHENILAVKLDGPTKEDYVWGFRTGFLTFAGKGLQENHYDAIIQKLMGAIRSSVSCCTTMSQTIMKKTLSNPNLEQEKHAFFEILEERYQKVRSFLETKKEHEVLEPLPFNSGYFMSFLCKKVNAEELRQKLLHEHGIGIIAIDDQIIRVAFSSIDTELIESVYETLYACAMDLLRA
ncbi:MAG: aminotransferase class I/II-fold pyridoxal phosphate-dependent enzyme [Spirochaetales bacterium]